MPNGDEIQLNDEVLKKLSGDVGKHMKAQLGVKQLPDGIETAIDEQVKLVAGDEMLKAISHYTDEAVISLAPEQAAAIKKIGRGLSSGLENIKVVSRSGEYLKMLEESANMMKAKYDALVTAGFTEEQSFRLVEAEALSRAGRTR